MRSDRWDGTVMTVSPKSVKLSRLVEPSPVVLFGSTGNAVPRRRPGQSRARTRNGPGRGMRQGRVLLA